VLVSWLLRGNLYGDVLERGPGGILRQVEIFHPDKVRPQMDTDGVIEWFVEGKRIPDGRILHRRVNPVPGCILGLSPVAYHAWTIGLSLTATRFGLQWFQDGAHPSGILRNTVTDLKSKDALSAKERFVEALRGSREPVVLGRGWEWTQLQLNPEESQFLETQNFSSAECARIFGPGIPEILGYAPSKSSLTYANVVDRDLHVLKYALNRWLRRLERLLSQFLPRPQYALFNRDALLQTNTLQRYQAHASALQNQWKVPNEIRDVEDMPPVPWGNEPIQGSGQPEPDEPPADGDEDEEDED
jgi:HK97 family phage portal protein